MQLRADKTKIAENWHRANTIRDYKRSLYWRYILCTIFIGFDIYSFNKIVQWEAVRIAWIAIFAGGNARVTTPNDNRPMTFISSIRRRVYFVLAVVIPLSLVRTCPFICVRFHLVFEPNPLSTLRTPFRSSYIWSVWQLRITKFVQSSTQIRKSHTTMQ